MKNYEVSLEIAGHTAMWTRPDTGAVPVSYPAPTYGSVKGIFESILWQQTAEVIPRWVEICQPVVYHNYTTNYGGPLRQTGSPNYQLAATVLINVCYRLYAEVVSRKPPRRDQEDRSGYCKLTTNGAHAYQEMFFRRQKRGQFFRVPCLGWAEFVPTYLGSLRPETRPDPDINLSLPSMLKTCFPNGADSKWDPVFLKNVSIIEGVMNYA
jgi:CRISPR-associated protein Cas5d